MKFRGFSSILEILFFVIDIGLKGQRLLGYSSLQSTRCRNTGSLLVLYLLLLFSRSVVSDSFATSWTVALQATLSVGFSRQENWSGLPFPSPGDLPDPGIDPTSCALQADSLLLNHQGSPFLFSLLCLLSFR